MTLDPDRLFDLALALGSKHLGNLGRTGVTAAEVGEDRGRGPAAVRDVML